MKGWTLRHAAEVTGISNGYLSLMEHGQVKAPSPSYLMAISNHYGLPYSQLMEAAGHPSGAVEVSMPKREMLAALDYALDLNTRGAIPSEVFGATANRASEAEPPAEPSADTVGLTRLLANDVSRLSLDEITQVRAFIAGLRAGRR